VELIMMNLAADILSTCRKDMTDMALLVVSWLESRDLSVAYVPRRSVGRTAIQLIGLVNPVN